MQSSPPVVSPSRFAPRSRLQGGGARRAFALLALAGGLTAASVAFAQQLTAQGDDLDPDYYAVVGRFGPDLGCVYGGSTANSGQVGVSISRTGDKTVAFAVGSIQILYDDGRNDPGDAANHECIRRVQVFNMMARVDPNDPAVQDRVEGVTNVFVQMTVNSTVGNPAPAFCTTTTPCQWSNQYLAPVDPTQCGGNSSDCPVTFGATSVQPLSVFKFATTDDQYVDDPAAVNARREITSSFIADMAALSGDPRDKITLENHVYIYPGKPYFDMSWAMDLSYNGAGKPDLDVGLRYAVDTFTAGVDYGFGYVCPVNGLAGATGGSAFFQGYMGLHKPTRSGEGVWADLFDAMAKDTLAIYFADNIPDADNPLAGADNPLRSLLDNGMVQEWEHVVLQNRLDSGNYKGKSYSQLRWTFDDPIRNNTFALSQSLFTMGNWEDAGKKREVVYDIQTRSEEARAELLAYQNPKQCKGSGSADCPDGGTCLRNTWLCPVELPGEPCPRYCADSTCNITDPNLDPMTMCGIGQACLFGFCQQILWRARDSMTTGGNQNREIFTINPTTGARFEVNGADLESFRQAMEVDLNHNGTFDDLAPAGEPDRAEQAHALRIVEWARGEKLQYTDGSNFIIQDNSDPQTDLLNTVMMRRRVDRSGNPVVLGEVTTATPRFIGPQALNPSYFVNQDKITGKVKYKDFTNTVEYRARPQSLFVVSNDGMVHLFDGLASVNAEELWAFMPWEVLPKLKEYAAPYYQQVRVPLMDLSPIVQDVYHPATDTWHTVLIVGMRAGGDAYYAFDVTYSSNPASNHLANPVFLWRVGPEMFPQLGRTYAKPSIMRVADSGAPGGERIVVAFGSGYADTTAEQFTKKGYLYLVDLWTNAGTGPLVIYSGEAEGEPLTNPDTSAPYVGNVVMSSAAVDTNADGYDDALYLGDLAGNLWRVVVDLDAASPAQFSLLYRTNESLPVVMNLLVENLRCQAGQDCDTTQRYYVPKYPRPIASTPATAYTEQAAVARSTNNNDKVMVLFGTGKFDSFYDSFDRFVQKPEEDVFANQVPYYQGIYGIVDRQDGTTVTESDLIASTINQGTATNGDIVRTIDTPASGAAGCEPNCRGWKLVLNCTLSDDGCDSDADNIPDTAGERMVTDPVFVDGRLFSTTFTPNQQGTCDLRHVQDSGGGFLMVMDYRDGSNPREPTLDSNANGIVNSNDAMGGTFIAGLRFNGSVLSAPVVDPISGSIYLKTSQDRPPMRVASRPTSSFKATKTIFVRLLN